MNQSFSNEQVFVSQLPDFENLTYQPLEPSYQKVMYISRGITWLIFVIATAFAIYFWVEVQLFWFYFVGFLVFWALLSFGLVSKTFHAKSYALRNHDIIYKTGFISLETTLLPFNRVQHVEIQEGPLMRIFGLATIEIYTAGGSVSDLKIAGLKKEDAESMKIFITKKITDEDPLESQEVVLNDSNNEIKEVNQDEA
jgi:membrane protein YdbS with pleckstrin-like domain